MPAGVSWGQYAKTVTIFFVSSILGSSLVSAYYRPLDNLCDRLLFGKLEILEEILAKEQQHS